MKRITLIIAMMALGATLSHAGPIAGDHDGIVTIPGIEAIGSLEIELKIRIETDSQARTETIVIKRGETAAVSRPSERPETTRTPLNYARGGIAVVRAFRCAAFALFERFVTFNTGR